MALDIDSFKEEEVSPAKLQKHIRELSEQLYRNVSLYADISIFVGLWFYHILACACVHCIYSWGSYYLWCVFCRRTQTPTWHSRKCLGHQRDPTWGCTRYPSLCWMMKRWRSCCKRVWQNTQRYHLPRDLRGNVSYLPDHPSVWPTLNSRNVLQ